MTGRVGDWDVGVLDMQTAEFEDNPSENFGVIRTKRSVFNPNSYIGAMTTSRLGTDGSYNVAYGLDGLFRVTGDEYLTLKWAQTFENDSINKAFDMAPSRFLFEWQRRKETGFGYDFVYTWSGKSFNPGIVRQSLLALIPLSVPTSTPSLYPNSLNKTAKSSLLTLGISKGDFFSKSISYLPTT